MSHYGIVYHSHVLKNQDSQLVFPGSVHWKDLETKTNSEAMSIHAFPLSWLWFWSTISHWAKTKLLGDIQGVRNCNRHSQNVSFYEGEAGGIKDSMSHVKRTHDPAWRGSQQPKNETIWASASIGIAMDWTQINVFKSMRLQQYKREGQTDKKITFREHRESIHGFKNGNDSNCMTCWKHQNVETVKDITGYRGEAEEKKEETQDRTSRQWAFVCVVLQG